MGDFNEVIHAHEHDGVANRSQAQMDLFRDALDTCGLTNIGYTGTNWTFEKKVSGGTYTRVRLDRGVGNAAFVSAFPNANIEHKSAASSDHIPILLRLRDVHACSRGPRPFKYELCWERDEALPGVVETGWARVAGDSVESLHGKLQGLSADLTHWERTHFGSVRREIDQLKRQVQILRRSQGVQDHAMQN
ncbi:uncharacterized protein [Aegilops tauschii subsp. strangulata]|uniref:uncharacterized protein n=1 Tax=Aegilops tauschii subsp. strangulata TaxID=200361 RepID=UPI003CC8A140